MDNRERELVERVLSSLEKGLTGAEEYANGPGGYAGALGYLEGYVKGAVIDLKAMLPVSHPTCAVMVAPDVLCGDPLHDRGNTGTLRCPTHGAVTS